MPTSVERGQVERRLGSLPDGQAVVVRTAEQAGVSAYSLALWSTRARREEVDGTTVLVVQAADLFVIMLAERRVTQTSQAMSWSCRIHQLYGPWIFDHMDLTPYQRERLGEAAAKIIYHVAGQLEAVEEDLERALEA